MKKNKLTERAIFVKAEFERLTKEGYRTEWIIRNLSERLFIGKTTIYNDLKK